MTMQRVASGDRIRAQDHNSVVEAVQRLHGFAETDDIPVEGSKFGSNPRFGDVAYVNDMAVEFGWADADASGRGREMVAVQIVNESTLKSALSVDRIFGVDADYKTQTAGTLSPKLYEFAEDQDVTPFSPNGKTGAFDGWMALPVRDLHETGLHGLVVKFSVKDEATGEKKPMTGYCFANTADEIVVKELLAAEFESYFEAGPTVSYDRAWCATTAAGGGMASTTGPRIVQRTFAKAYDAAKAKRAFDVEWQDEEKDPETGEVTKEGGWYLRRCYWQEGGFTRAADDMKIEIDESDTSSETGSGAGDGSGAQGEETGGPTEFAGGTLLCFQVRLYASGTEGGEDECKFVKFDSVGSLNLKQSDDQYYIVPLYLTTESTDPADWIDLRTKPELQVFDHLQADE